MNTTHFEAFLADQFYADNPMLLDDDMPDAFDDYLSTVTPDKIHAAAEKYYEQHPPLMMKIMGRSDFVEYFHDPAEYLAREYCQQQGIA